MESSGFFIEVNTNLNHNIYSTEWYKFILKHSGILLVYII
jgi:hypothetical protein